MGGAGARIRLARFGRRNSPFYNIVVIDRRKARNARPIEVLGTYDPIPRPPTYGEGRPSKAIRVDLERARYWLGNGALPSDTVWRLLSMVGLLQPKFRVDAAPVGDAHGEESGVEAGVKVESKTEGKTEA